MKLPIQFTKAAWISFAVFPDRVGAVVLMLIDLLSAYEGKLVTLSDIVELYPYGFYSEDAMIKKIDFLKEDRVLGENAKEKFSFVY